jgi:hypothetical protein
MLEDVELERKGCLDWHTFTDLEANVVPVWSSESAMAGYGDGSDGGVYHWC